MIASEIINLPRAKMGWSWLDKLAKELARIESTIELVYLFKTKELVITDDYLLELLTRLDIPHTLSSPDNSIKFILVK